MLLVSFTSFTVEGAAKKKPPSSTSVPTSTQPVITQQPADVRIDEGLDAVFQVGTRTSARFQWTYNGQDIPGANGDTLRLNDVQHGQHGSYAVRVSHNAGTETSRSANLDVIFNQPVSPNFVDQVFAGYQGWFSADGDGAWGGWDHWSGGGTPAPNNVRFEIYPDTREYSQNDLFATNLGNLGDGRPAKLFSSSREGVIATHFRWVAEYGIDGLALQRFLTMIESGGSKEDIRNDVLMKVKRQAEQWNKSFYVMYDLTGSTRPNIHEIIKYDWQKLESRYAMTASFAYAKQLGRPVVALWGVGNGQNALTASQTIDLIRWFKARNVFVIGGLYYFWREHTAFIDAYKQLDMIIPWAVGTFAAHDVANHHNNVALADKAFCNQHGIAYQRVIWPGFAWSNWNGGARNAFPRNNGTFFWEQAFYTSFLKGGAFIAMFDEFDEGTAIAKAAENASMIPNNQYFLTLDADGRSLSSDFYLRLTGEAARMIKGQRNRTKSVPIPDR